MDVEQELELYKTRNKWFEAYPTYFWYDLSSNPNELSLDFIRKYKSQLQWHYISKKRQDINIDFIEEFKDYINFHQLLIWYNFSEDELRQYQDYLDFKLVFRFQKISIDFVKEFLQHFNKKMLYRNKNFTRSDKIRLGKLHKMYKDLI